MKSRLTTAIIVAMALGVVAGIWLNGHASGPANAVAASLLPSVSDLFLRLIKMVIAPLVLSTLIVGIAHTGDVATLGRMGLRAMLWFLAASLVSLLFGWAAASLLRPGAGAHMIQALATTGPVPGGPSAHALLADLVPVSIVQALASNAVLQIVVFSIFAGVALTAMGEAARPLIAGLEALSAMMLRITGYVMWAAPAAVFAAVAEAVAQQGPAIMWIYGRLTGEFYLSLALLWLILFAAGTIFAGPGLLRLPGFIREPLMIAFSTASSEAALAPTLEALERFGTPPRVSGFVVPLAYAFNLDGAMMYCSFAAMFIIQAYGVHLSLSSQLMMLGTFMLTSKGIAGVPRASLVVLAATLPRFGIPETALVLVLAVDHFLDMGRTATNVVGAAIAAAVVGRGEAAAPAPAPSVAPTLQPHLASGLRFHATINEELP